MKIHKLEIEKIRGIKKLIIEPKGKNFVVFGPNGSGKSGIVDAVDFLLTGRISRLEGEGGEFLSTQKHGPHVDHLPKEAVVVAHVEVPGVKELVKLERRMAQPTKLLCEAQYEKEISPALFAATIGLHRLSRKEILKYIMSSAGKRATEIQALLNLELVDKVRKSLVSVRNNAEKNKKVTSDSFETKKIEIKTLLELMAFSETACLEEVNKLRKILKVEPITELKKDELKKGVTPLLGKSEEDILSVDNIKAGIKNLRDLSPKTVGVLKKDVELRKIISDFNKDTKLRKEVIQSKLVNLGLELLQDEDACPLCQKEWNNQLLEEFLNKRLNESTKGQLKIDDAKKKADEYRPQVLEVKNNLNGILQKYKALKLKENESKLLECVNTLNDILNVLLEPIEKYKEDDKCLETILNTTLQDLLDAIEKELVPSKYEASSEEKASTKLTKLEVLLEQYSQNKNSYTKADKIFKQAELVLIAFEKARDQNLDTIFEKINADFCGFYKVLHDEDEKDFESNFTADEAKLIFEVDFYRRGKFHPGALHSEGHQDSMGLCLFLALNKFLADGKLSVAVLDDVVMSIDSGHRKSTCDLLLRNFSDRQFIITTHDRVWAYQLKSEGVVTKKNMVEFKWWSLETGPLGAVGKEFWDSIEDDLKKNEVGQAAWKLRKNSECYFDDVCDAIRAEVVYRSNGRWQLGDFLPAAIKRLTKLLTKAKNSASSWNKPEDLEKLKAFDDKFTEVVRQSKCEEWAVNVSVHYNKWETLQANEFKPVVEAFKELFSVFVCNKCGQLIHVLMSDNFVEESLKCSCGEINCNLISNEEV